MAETVEVENKVLEFYRRVIFGSNYSKKDIMNCCFHQAWKTMARTLSNIKDQNQRNSIKEILQNYLVCDSEDKSNGISEKIQNNKYEIIQYLVNQTQVINKNFTIGQCQKVVNMFFKYIYTFKEELKLDKEQFANCDCVIDRTNIERLNADIDNYNQNSFEIIEKVKITAWSKIDDETVYNDFQNKVGIILDGQYENKLDYEFGWGRN